MHIRRLIPYLLLVQLIVACRDKSALVEAAKTLPNGHAYMDERTGIRLTMHNRSAGVRGSSGWYTVTSTGAGFTVLLPGAAADFTQEAPTTDGVGVRAHTVGLKTTEGVKFTAICTERNDHFAAADSGDSVLKSLATSNASARITKVTRGSLSGSRLTLEENGSRFEAEAFVAEGRMYELMLEYPSSEYSYMPPVSEEFFRSFRPGVAPNKALQPDTLHGAPAPRKMPLNANR